MEQQRHLSRKKKTILFQTRSSFSQKPSQNINLDRYLTARSMGGFLRTQEGDSACLSDLENLRALIIRRKAQFRGGSCSSLGTPPVIETHPSCIRDEAPNQLVKARSCAPFVTVS
jgi:hypothetical protein